MVDFAFLQNPITKKWVILAPRRAKRPNVAKGTEPVCPFCVGREKDESEVYRVSASGIQKTQNTQNARASENQDIGNSDISENSGSPSFPSVLNQDQDWLIRVVPNKFPFAPIHEIIIHSPDHHKNFGELTLDQVQLILETYKARYNGHKDKGQVYIFHNRGEQGGESLPHPHTQLAVVPPQVKMDIPILSSVFSIRNTLKTQQDSESDTSDNQNFRISDTPSVPSFPKVSTSYFEIFCPSISQWPDEVWVAPKKGGRAFGEIEDEEIADLAYIINRLVQIMDLRHGHEFPYNFYIYPGGDWYLRLIPRTKTLGGFEVGTGIIVNTQNPDETIQFIKTHFENPDEEKIKKEHQAEYEKTV